MENLVKVKYDDNYLGQGYFILVEDNGVINKFVKFYTSGNFGFPNFHVRAFESGVKDLPDDEFRNVELVVRRSNNSKLCDYLKKLRIALLFHNKCQVNTIDVDNQGMNHIKVVSDSIGEKLIISKSIYKGRFTTPDYIDVMLGDYYTCLEYESILAFYHGLSKCSEGELKKKDIAKLILK